MLQTAPLPSLRIIVRIHPAGSRGAKSNSNNKSNPGGGVDNHTINIFITSNSKAGNTTERRGNNRILASYFHSSPFISPYPGWYCQRGMMGQPI